MDIAKQIFELHGVDRRGKVLLRRTVRRERLLEFLAQLKPCEIGMEACGGAHYWHREISRLGHTVRLLSAHKVKPYLDGNKNNRHDAAAICEAMSRPAMRFVAPKSPAQQDLQTLHRARNLLVRDLTALSNQIRGQLHEYGIVMRKGAAALKRALPELLASSDERLTPVLRETVAEQFERFNYLAQRLERYDRRITQLCQQDPRCRRLLKIEGVGPLSATALVAAIGNGHEFHNGRHFSAYLGLVPGHSNTGDKTVMLGITKRGNRYLRTLLIHGGRSAVYAAIRCPPPHRPARGLAQSAAGGWRPQCGGSGANQQERTGGVGDTALWRGLLSGAGASPDAPPPRAPLGQRKNAGLRRAGRPPRRSEQRAFSRPALSSYEGRDEKMLKAAGLIVSTTERPRRYLPTSCEGCAIDTDG
jgi:transposase